MLPPTTAILDRRNRPLRDLRISVTDRCNFRCGYCMPKDIFGRGYKFLRKKQLLSYEEIQRLVTLFSGFGVTKLRLTGGEPLLRKDIERLISMLAGIRGIDDIALTTNASLLTVERAKLLRNSGLNRVNISLDALDRDIYQQINEINSPLDHILRGIDHALEAGFEAVKVNMVVQKGVNHTDILPMVRRFRNSGVILRFIEFMDVGNYNHWSLDKVFTAGEIVKVIHDVFPLQAMEANYHGEVAKRWRYLDGSGEIGVIASISQPFCGGCARARLSAVGELFTCLFATTGFNLHSLLRAGCSDDVIAQKIEQVWGQREDRYSESRPVSGDHMTPGSNSQKVEMSYIGG